MHRPLWVRLFIGLWAVWFNAALLEAPGVHACPVHSSVAVASLSHGSEDMPMHAHTAEAPSQDGKTCACTCLGVCCGVSPFVSSDAQPNIAEHYAALTPRRIGQSVVAPTVYRPFARPFANGPPATTV